MTQNEREQGKPDYEKVRASELKRQAIERQALEDAAKEAKAHALRDARQAGRDELELVEMEKWIDEKQAEQRKAQAEAHEKRLDNFALLYLGPPSERDKGLDVPAPRPFPSIRR